jgi:hypothetical protein
MRNASPVIAAVIAITALGCGSKTPPVPTSLAGTSSVKFTAALSPANEVPAVANAENTGSGTATITLNITKDSTGAIIGATADFSVNLNGFPAGTPINIAHIHPGVAGQNGGVLVNTGLTAGELNLAAGSGSFAKNGIAVGASDATGMINTPANYYFNVHSTINAGGVARGQMVKQ